MPIHTNSENTRISHRVPPMDAAALFFFGRSAISRPLPPTALGAACSRRIIVLALVGGGDVGREKC